MQLRVKRKGEKNQEQIEWQKAMHSRKKNLYAVSFMILRLYFGAYLLF